MADLERGERIKRLRAQAHLTQPATADMVGVTLRAYQEWEAGGGIQWENVKRLASVLDVDADYVMRGERSETPDLSGSGSQLDRIEAQLTQLQEALDLERAAATIRAAEVLRRIAEAEEAIRHLLPSQRRAGRA